MEYKVISGDGHIDLKFLPFDLFLSNAPPNLKDRVPQVIETDQGPKWFAEGKDLANLPLGNVATLVTPKRGLTKRIDRMHDSGFFEGGPHASNPELRMKDQDIDGVDAEVIYGILSVDRFLSDHEMVHYVYETYNTWVAEFSATNSERLVGLSCIPNDDPELAAKELRRCAKMGIRGADFAVSTAPKPLWHTDWDVLWAAADECNMPISFHTTGYPLKTPANTALENKFHMPSRLTFLTMFQLAGAEFLTSIIFSGATDRYPGLKFVLGECGAGWVPYILARMEDEYEDYEDHMEFPLRPTEYWRRQGYTTFQHESIMADIYHLAGEDNILWGSDYPHPDGVWPDSREVVEQDLGRIDERARRKITCENTGKLYGLIK